MIKAKPPGILEAPSGSPWMLQYNYVWKKETDRLYGPEVQLPIPPFDLQELWKHIRLSRPQIGSLSHERPWSNCAGRGQTFQVLLPDMRVPEHSHHLAALLEVLWLSTVHHPWGRSQSLASSQELPVLKWTNLAPPSPSWPLPFPPMPTQPEQLTHLAVPSTAMRPAKANTNSF